MIEAGTDIFIHGGARRGLMLLSRAVRAGSDTFIQGSVAAMGNKCLTSQEDLGVTHSPTQLAAHPEFSDLL